jgi:hypothetical protein
MTADDAQSEVERLPDALLQARSDLGNAESDLDAQADREAERLVERRDARRGVPIRSPGRSKSSACGR